MERKDDGSLCWTYIGVWNRTHCRILWIVWLCMILLLFSCFGMMAAVAGLEDKMKRFLMWIALGFAGFVTAIFALIWLWERFATKKYSYTVDDRKLTVAYGRHRHIFLNRIKSLAQQREWNAIVLKAAFIPIEIFVSDSDYDEIWNYLTVRCPNGQTRK